MANNSDHRQSLIRTVNEFRDKAQVINPFHPDVDGIHTDLYDYYTEQEDAAFAEEKYEEALQIYTQLGNAICNLSAFYMEINEYDKAKEGYLEVIQIFEALGFFHDMAVALAGLANAERDSGNYEDAYANYEAAIIAYEQEEEDYRNEIIYVKLELSTCYRNESSAYLDDNDFDEAETYGILSKEVLEDVVDIYQELIDEDQEYQEELDVILETIQELDEVLVAIQEHMEKKKPQQEEETVEQEYYNEQAHKAYLLTVDGGGNIWEDNKKAYAAMYNAVNIYRNLVSDEACNKDYRPNLTDALFNLADICLCLNKLQEAYDLFQEILDILSDFAKLNEELEPEVDNAIECRELIQGLLQLEEKNGDIVSGQIPLWEKLSKLRPDYLTMAYCQAIVIYVETYMNSGRSILTDNHNNMLDECSTTLNGDYCEYYNYVRNTLFDRIEAIKELDQKRNPWWVKKYGQKNN